MINSKIEIKLECFNHEPLNLACDKIMERMIEKHQIDWFGLVIPLPTKKRIYCVLRSPHVDKDSREHFEIRRHKRFIQIYYDATCDNLHRLMAETNLPAGVFCKVTFSSI